jgi:Reverse transcriptase (RNA-dependent DNA polymerase)
MRAIWKKGSKEDPQNYRILTIGDNFFKFCEGIVLEHLRNVFEEDFGVTQHGFRSKHGTHTAIERMHKNQRGTGLNPSGYFLQLDLKKAFTSLDRTRMLKFVISKYNYIFFHKMYNLRET